MQTDVPAMRRGEEVTAPLGLHLTNSDIDGPTGCWRSADGFLVHWDDDAREPMPAGVRVWISARSPALTSHRIRGFEVQLGSVPVVVIDRADDGLATFPLQWSIPVAQSWLAVPSVVNKLLGPIRAALLQVPLQLADQHG